MTHAPQQRGEQAALQLGRLFMVALTGDHVTVAERLVLREMQPAGLTLFKRNLINLEQICRLTDEIHGAFDHNQPQEAPIIAIDQEGGTKERLPTPFTHWPGNHLLGQAARGGGATELTQAEYHGIARELAVVGINTNFAPVVDIVDQHEAVISSRSFGSGPNLVGDLGCAAIAGTREVGVIPCAKHFPGHGATTVDSHLDLPTIDKPLARLQHHELVPFRAAIAADCPMVMTAHILFPQIDAQHPATLSHRWLQGILRSEMGFTGLLVTDDLNMMAVANRYGAEQAARLALAAGNDLLLYCDGVDKAYAIFRTLREALLTGQEPELATQVITAAERLTAWRQRFFANPPRADLEEARRVVGGNAHRQLAHNIRQHAEAADQR